MKKKSPLIVLLMMVAVLSKSQTFEYAKTITSVKGVINYLEDKETVVIVPEENTSQRYISQQLPQEYKKEGLKVIFTGDVGKIPPNVRMMGTLLKLTCICVSKSEQKKFGLKKRKYVFS